MIVLGYSGLDASVSYARRDADLRPGEERIVQGLDSAAAIVADGEIVAAAAEERFGTEKHTNRFPYESIGYCLSAAGISVDQIDVVAHGFDYGRYASAFRATDAQHYEAVLDPARQVEMLRDRFGPSTAKKFMPVQHHLAHGASAYFPSGFDEALCVVCDGMGEIESLSVYAVKGSAFRLLARHSIKQSLGILYSLVTMHLGFKFNADEYKLMGLAPYGNAEMFRDLFDAVIQLHPEGRYELRLERLGDDRQPHYRGIRRYLQESVIPTPDSQELLPQRHCDLAAAVQECLEKVLLHVIGHWRTQTGLRNLCMAGGVALNCTFNGKLAQSRLFDRIFVQPAAGDDGTAVGAALSAVTRAEQRLSPAIVQALPFYGPAYDDELVAATIAERAQGLVVANLGSPQAAAEDAAEALERDLIIAWFQGRMEYGPRALGNRSILANPLIADIKERLNRIIKLREGFRPFAPAVTIERARDYFEFSPSSMFDFMLATCPVRPEWRTRLPGVTHVDGSARMQTVDSDRNALFHRLITAFGRRTGVHCVVNTSFNLRGQPMIVSPSIAIDTFRKVRLDRLYLGPFRLSKTT